MSSLSIALLVALFIFILGALVGTCAADHMLKHRIRRQAQVQRQINAQRRALQATQASIASHYRLRARGRDGQMPRIVEGQVLESEWDFYEDED
jgi:uncharacterized membrane-anchored protein YhcB (DUF1043 family)